MNPHRHQKLEVKQIGVHVDKLTRMLIKESKASYFLF